VQCSTNPEHPVVGDSAIRKETEVYNRMTERGGYEDQWHVFTEAKGSQAFQGGGEEALKLMYLLSLCVSSFSFMSHLEKASERVETAPLCLCMCSPSI
jgi:hypothetical protein